MTYIGANDIVINNALRLLGGINKPYLLLAVTFLIGSFISLAGFGATSLAVLLMSTLFPVLNALGLPAISIAAVIATTATISFSPLAVDSVIAAENVGMSVEMYTLKYQIPLAIPSMLAMAAAHYFWQQFMDKKQGLLQKKAAIRKSISKTSMCVPPKLKARPPVFTAGCLCCRLLCLS